MCQIKSWNKFVVLLLMVQIVSGATRYVAKDGTADFTSIQKAIDASGTNDIVEILDNGIYEEQVNIDSTKTGLTLRAASILKPTIKWRDTLSTFPETPMEAQDNALTTEAEKKGIYFDQNGALRILRAQKITIEGIIIDGGGPYPFYGSGVWGASDLFHGNSALVLWISGDAVIRNCEMQNAYFGIAVKDRNLGGVFANVNPRDNDSTKNAPLSGFGKTGNHLFEQNRIHDNSWGMFFESAWDRGSVVRYNLFYENHHASSSFAEKVSGMGGEGGNQSGGAVLLKDVRHSPVAFYNNTFWHNIINIGGQWQAGAQHLIFNNIFGPPAELWSEDDIFGNNAENFAMDIAHIYRLKHNLYSVMKEWNSAEVYIGMNLTDPETGQNVQSEPQNVDVTLPIISNDLRELEKGGYFNVTIPYSSGDVDTVIYTDNNQVISPGALILGKSAEPFPSDANNRWFEPVFKSTDPENPNFLVPDWNDTSMFKYVVDKGYPDAGILDADGSIADLGAIPYNGELPSDKIVINPTKPVIISGSGGNTKATINFRMYSIAGEMKDPQIKYIRWIYKLPDQKDTWGKQADIIEREGIYIPTENPTVQMGLNTMALSIPALGTNDSTGFFEIIVEGTGSNGQKVTSSVGFIPYRELKYEFEIKVLDLNETTELDQVQVGTPVKMQIIPRKIDGTQLDKDITVDYVNLALSSIEYNLKDTSGNDLLFLTGLPVTGTIVPVMFTRIPDGGMEMITATGMFDTTSSEGFTDAIMGASDPIRILPGDPATIEFQDPPSGNKNYPGIIQPGELRETLLYVFDKYGNKVITPADVSVKSLSSEIGNFIGSKNGKSDESGEVIFDSLVVVNGTTDDVFAIEAKLVFNGKDLGYDTTYLKVGKITDRFVIFYSDTNGYNPTIIIDECSSERVPVTIRAMASENIIETRNTKFQIAFDKQGLAAYGSKTSSEPVTQATLVDGETVIWVQPNVPEINNGTIEIIPVGDRTILKGSRDGINFRYCDNPVGSAFYYTDYGNGAVNRIEIHFQDPLDEESIPDTMIFYWPDPSVERIVTSGMTIDSEDP
ncbi:MAG: hypothetical protein GXY77_18135, partial [Fibrobacter sp.]|nr:hypothetical protein [Fibrobacter sp.]